MVRELHRSTPRGVRSGDPCSVGKAFLLDPAVIGDSSVPIEPRSGETLEDQRVRRRVRGGRGGEAPAIRDAILGIARALAAEFSAERMVLRFTSEDIVHDLEQGSYTISDDLPRYPVDTPPTGLSFLDNGIYAPELTKQINRPLSPRTDVYSLGAVLYYWITGLDPIPEFARLADQLPPVRIFEPKLPLGIDPILRCALARLPEDRFSDPVALLEALETVIDADLQREAYPRGTLAVRIGSATHGGINKSTKNPRNQDQYFVGEDEAGEVGLFLVADGVSTADIGSGDRAAEHVVRATQVVWRDLIRNISSVPAAQWDLPDLLRQIFERANAAICREVAEIHPHPIDSKYRVMSSTAVAFFRRGREACLANVGDSRIYVIREEWIDQVTVDGDRRTKILRKGRGLEAILNASGLGELTNAIGQCTRDEEGIVAVPVVPEFTTLSLLPGDRILVCSDGIPDCIGRNAEARIHEIILEADRPARGAWNLLVAANERGGDDNITAILVHCDEKEV